MWATNWKDLVMYDNVKAPQNDFTARLHIHTDKTAWIKFSDGSEVPIRWAGESKLLHWHVWLNRYETTNTRNSFPDTNLSGSTHLFDSVWGAITAYRDDYHKSFVKIVWFDSGNNVIEEFDELVFSTELEFYDFLRANAAQSGGDFTYTNVAYVYDIIDNSIQPINKLYGKNALLGALRGRWRHYKDWDNTAWSWVDHWFVQEVIRRFTSDNLYTYNGVDLPWDVLWLSVNWRKMYGLLSEWAIINNNSGNRRVHSTVSNAIEAWHTWDYSIDQSKTQYWLLDLTNRFNMTRYDKDKIANLAHNVCKEHKYSACIFYSLIDQSTWDYETVFIKPLWIDTVYINFVDDATYDLYAYYESKNKYGTIKKMDLTAIDQYAWGDVAKLEKWDWMEWYPSSLGIYWKSSSYEMPSVKFFKKDKITNKISPLSQSKIYRERPRRDAPVSAMIR